MKKISVSLIMWACIMPVWSLTPMWLRYAAISPQGDAIAFVYKGAVYKVPVQGGEAVQLTSGQSYCRDVVWSPDSREIAFSSDRAGSFDVYVIPSAGGEARRLTSLTGNEYPTAWTPDGKEVVFTASIQDPAKSMLFPRNVYAELYSTPAQGGRMKQILAVPAEKVCYDKHGKFFLYQDVKGLEDKFRKHHTSSVTRDIWRYDIRTRRHTNLTCRGGEDRNPILAPDGKTIYFLSERNGGSFNVYTMDMTAPESVKAVTHMKTHPVRFLSASNKGTLCYTYDGEIYTQENTTSSPHKVNISVKDNMESKPSLETINGGLSSSAISPDGKEVAFVHRGEVFVTSMEYATTKRITNTAAAERTVTWADNRTLVYASERDGLWQLYKATIAHKEDQNFSNATVIKEEHILASNSIERAYPQFSPDGKELAFIENRNKLMVLNVASKKIRQVTDGSQWYTTSGEFSYSWSPDGKWFALEIIANGHEPYCDVAIVSAQGGKPTNISRSGYFSESPQWTADGEAVIFITDRYGMRSHASWGSLNDVMIAFVNQDAYDKFQLSKEDYELRKELEKQQKNDKEAADKKKAKDGKNKKDKEKEKADSVKAQPKIQVEPEGIEDRVVRITRKSDWVMNCTGAQGNKIYYFISEGGGCNVYSYNLITKEHKSVGSVPDGNVTITNSKDFKTLACVGSRHIRKLETASDKISPVSFSGSYYLDHAAEREYMFNHVCLQEKKRFYNLNMHGVDWESMCQAYRKFLPHISNNRDFADLLSELLGELNVSHTGGRYYSDSPALVVANLGLLYDWNYNGKGMKVDEIVTGGPFDHKNTRLKAGCVIEKINDQSIETNTAFYAMMEGLAGKKTSVAIYNPSTGERWNEVTLPVNDTKMNDLLYKRWVKRCGAMVDSLSKGRLGYVHIKSMDDASFRTVYSDILGKYNKKEGIVIDTRNNGGGRLHEDIEVLFSGEKYLTQVIRGKESCDMPSRRWNKPSIMLQCEANYSNAHGTPWVYKHKKIGKLVGMPVPGTMTSVSWETLQDPSLVFGIPIIGYRTKDGSYLENSQLEPDFKVANAPEDVVAGKDAQIETAVRELLKQIDKKQ